MGNQSQVEWLWTTVGTDYDLDGAIEDLVFEIVDRMASVIDGPRWLASAPFDRIMVAFSFDTEFKGEVETRSWLKRSDRQLIVLIKLPEATTGDLPELSFVLLGHLTDALRRVTHKYSIKEAPIASLPTPNPDHAASALRGSSEEDGFGEGPAEWAQSVLGEVPDSDVLIWLPQSTDKAERADRSERVNRLLARWIEEDPTISVSEIDEYTQATAWMVRIWTEDDRL